MPAKAKTIHAKLMEARKAFHQLPLKKSGYNSFSKYSYFELADFLVPGMDCMADQGLVPVISFTADVATMTIHDVDSEATIVITSPMKEIILKGSNEMQALGGVETYNSRYLWTAAMQCVENDLLDSQPPVPDTKPAAPAKLPTDAQWVSLKEYIEANQIPPATLEWLRKDDGKNWNALTHSKMLKVLKVCKEFKPGE
jgi:hypothetical protein